MNREGGHVDTIQRGGESREQGGDGVPPFQPDPNLVRWAFGGGSKESAVRAFKKTWERHEQERARLAVEERSR